MLGSFLVALYRSHSSDYADQPLSNTTTFENKSEVLSVPNNGECAAQLRYKILVEGSVDFKDRIFDAFAKFEELCPSEIEFIRANVVGIRESKHSGFNVGNGRPWIELAKPTWGNSVTWCAGSLSHEAYHAYIYRRCNRSPLDQPTDGQTVQSEELQCIAHQLKVLRSIGAPEWETKALDNANGLHFDLNGNGKLDAEDYELRKW